MSLPPLTDEQICATYARDLKDQDHFFFGFLVDWMRWYAKNKITTHVDMSAEELVKKVTRAVQEGMEVDRGHHCGSTLINAIFDGCDTERHTINEARDEIAVVVAQGDATLVVFKTGFRLCGIQVNWDSPIEVHNDDTWKTAFDRGCQHGVKYNRLFSKGHHEKALARAVLICGALQGKELVNTLPEFSYILGYNPKAAFSDA